MTTCRKAAWLAAAMASCVHAVPTLAESASANQDATATQTGAESEIVVTAQRREQSLSDVGMSITALGGAALETRNVNDTGDLAKLVPGFSVGETGFNTPVYTLRGVGVNEQSIGNASSVAIYTDEVPLPYPVMTVGATLDVQRIEVLKGPQGTLYGQNSTGGAVNYITNKPGDRLEAGITGSYGRFNAINLTGYVSTPISDTLGIRVAGRLDHAGPWQTSLTRDDKIGKVRRFAGRVLVKWEPSSNFSALLNFNGFKDTSDNLVPQLVQVVQNTRLRAQFPFYYDSPKPDSARRTDWDPGKDYDRDNRLYQIALSMNWSLNEALTLTSITAYSDYKKDDFIENDGTQYNQSEYTTNGSIKAFSQELRLAAQFSGVRWLLGGNISRDRPREYNVQLFTVNGNVTALGTPGFTAIAADSRQKVRSWAVFTNIDIPITSQLDLIGGLRLSEDRRSVAQCTRDPGFGGGAQAFQRSINSQRAAKGLAPITITPGGCTTYNENLEPTLFRDKLVERNAPWDVTLNYKPVRDTILYGRIAKGFKSGNFPTLGATLTASYFPVVQEELLAYELGAKVRISRALRFETAIFRYDYTNKQMRGRVPLPVFGLQVAQVNVPKSRIKGAEGTIVLTPIEGLSLVASGTYLDAKIKRFVGSDFSGVFVDQSGQTLNFTSKYSANADASYEHPLSDSLTGFIGANLAYRSKQVGQISAPAAFLIKPYTLLDAQLGIENHDKHWKAWIWGKNLTNKYYWTSVSQFSQSYVKYPGMPITYGISASFKY
jgi:iron complex outermembrane recepter protein